TASTNTSRGGRRGPRWAAATAAAPGVVARSDVGRPVRSGDAPGRADVGRARDDVRDGDGGGERTATGCSKVGGPGRLPGAHQSRNIPFVPVREGPPASPRPATRPVRGLSPALRP